MHISYIYFSQHEELDTHHKISRQHKQSAPRAGGGPPVGAARLGRAALQKPGIQKAIYENGEPAAIFWCALVSVPRQPIRRSGKLSVQKGSKATVVVQSSLIVCVA